MHNKTRGWINGLLGVIIFSGSLPATRVAVTGFDPLFLTAARASIAGLLGLLLLLALRVPRPKRADMAALATVAIGVVVGFPLFSALALQHITAARSLVFLGLLPLATALFGVIRAGERPRPAFWVFTLLGSLCIASFAFSQGAASSVQGDTLMMIAIVTCGYGYAEGGRLSRHLGGWQVISWALVIALPFMLVAAWICLPDQWQGISTSAWAGLIYVSLFSMLIGFFFWYRGLAQGGIAAVGQLQLLQPFMGLALAAALLHEEIGLPMIAATLGVVVCVACARRFN